MYAKLILPIYSKYNIRITSPFARHNTIVMNYVTYVYIYVYIYIYIYMLYV